MADVGFVFRVWDDNICHVGPLYPLRSEPRRISRASGDYIRIHDGLKHPWGTLFRIPFRQSGRHQELVGPCLLLRGIAYLLLLTLPAPLNLWIFAVFAGFSWVATPVLTSSLTADVYGLKALGTISGLTFMFHQFGGFSSVLLAGLLFDVTGSYTIPFAIAGALLVPAALSAFSIKERKYSVRYQAHPTSVTSSAADVS